MLLTLVPDPLRRSVGNPHADCSKTSLELSFRPAAPTDGAPSGIGQHVFGCHRQDVRNVPRPATGQIIRTSAGYTLRCRGIPTAQASLRAVSPWRNGALSPYPASASTQPKRTPAAIARSISAKAISGLVRAVRCSTGTPARPNRARLL